MAGIVRIRCIRARRVRCLRARRLRCLRPWRFRSQRSVPQRRRASRRRRTARRCVAPSQLAACGAPGRDGRARGLRTASVASRRTRSRARSRGRRGSRWCGCCAASTCSRRWSLALAAGLAFAAVRVLRTRARQRALVPLRARRTRRARRPLAAGLLTGFLPCGALASALDDRRGRGVVVGRRARDDLVFALASAPGLVAVVVAGRGAWAVGCAAPRRRLRRPRSGWRWCSRPRGWPRARG